MQTGAEACLRCSGSVPPVYEGKRIGLCDTMCSHCFSHGICFLALLVKSCKQFPNEDRKEYTCIVDLRIFWTSCPVLRLKGCGLLSQLSGHVFTTLLLLILVSKDVD